MKINTKKNVETLTLESIISEKLVGSTLLQINRFKGDGFTYETGVDEGYWSDDEDIKALGKKITDIDLMYFDGTNTLILDLQVDNADWITITEKDSVRVKHD